MAFLLFKIEGRHVHIKRARREVKGSETGEPVVYKLKRSLCTARHSVLWYDVINAVMLNVGFTPTQFDPCVFTCGRYDTFRILYTSTAS